MLLIGVITVNIDEAEARLKNIIGHDLRTIAEEYNITIFHPITGKLNKGWAGQAMLRFLHLPLDSSQSPDGGTWELKVIPFMRAKTGEWKPKETMAITMINAQDVAAKSFEDSYLYMKIRCMIVCGREYIDRQETSSPLIRIDKLDLDDHEDLGILRQIKDDYEEVQYAIRTRGFESLTGRMGVYVQPRTKGPGHGSTSRAFYGRPILIKKMLKLEHSLFD